VRARVGQGAVLVGVLLVGSLGVGLWGADTPPRADLPKARRVVEPVAPVLPAEVVAALQESRYAEADRLLERLAAANDTPAARRAYFALIRAVAQRLDTRTEAALATLKGALAADPQGPWAPKLRGELATVELAAGHPDQAEALARAAAEALLADGRKDRLAAIYHAFARQLLQPDNPLTPPDPEGAYALLVQARQLAKSESLRARLLFAMARASQATGNHGRTLQDFQTYLKDYPKGADRFEARYDLGEAQMAAGHGPQAARPTWSDLVRDLENVDTKEAQDLRARALLGIARTYGLPNPPNDTSLNLGVAALRRLLRDHPAHPEAVRAAYAIGISYLNRGKSQEAVEALTAFLKGQLFKVETDDAQRALAQLRMTATFQVAQILQGQQKFDEAISAFKGYLAQFPDGPQSADAQRAILDTELAKADDARRRDRHAEARALWQSFAAQNPLDGRVPQVLFQIGESFAAEKKFDDAMAAWETLAGKFPNTEPAAHAQFQIALVFETEKGDLPEAIERYKKVAVEPWQSQAQQRIAIMEAKSLVVITPRTFRSGETAHLKIATRNLETLTFTAYKLNPESYFRKKHALNGVESLDIGLVAPDAEWTASVPGYAKYKPIETKYDLKVKVPGVWVVKVTDEKHLQATTLVVGSDIDAIVKTSRDQVLVFAQDMKTGKGRPNARVLVAQGDEVILEAKTGDDGVLLKSWDKPREPNSGLDYLVLDGPDVAGTGLGVPGTVAQGLSPRAYIYTDRPAYRPGQEVALRGVVREIKDGQYDPQPGGVYRLEVTDSRGRPFHERSVTLSEFGTFHETLELDEGAPVGTYRVRVYQPGKSDFAGTFEVQAYQLQKVDLDFDLPKTVYFRGETIKADLVARYQYGTPLAGHPIVVQLPDGRVLQGTTDAEGKYHVEFPTEGFSEEQALQLAAQLPQDGVAASAQVMLAVRAFRIDLGTDRDVYLDGESFRLRATTLDALGEPTGQDLTVAVLKRIEQPGRVAEREVIKKDLKTDAKTGKGSVTLAVEDADGGSYVVRVTGTDRFKNPVVAERALTISGKKDETKMRLLTDRSTFQVGEEAKVNLHSRVATGRALLTWEADRILKYKLIEVKEGDNPLAWQVDGPQFPNFTLTAVRMADTKLHEARLDLRIERDLRVTVKPTKPTVGPGEEVEVEVTTVDQLDRPVAAELSLALVDRALLRLYGDRLPPIGPFFYNQTRTGAFSTSSTIAFRYQPPTVPVAEAVVEDMERRAAEEKDVAAADEARKKGEAELRLGQANGQPPVPPGQFNFGMSAPAMSPPPPNAGAYAAFREIGPDGKPMGGMGGRLGGSGEVAGRQFQVPMAGEPLADQLKETVDAASALSASPAGGRAALKSAARRDSRSRQFFAEDKKKAGLEAQPREQFVETAYWNPSVVTDKQGKARVTFKAPMALSEYRFTARGVTGAETLAGQTTADLAVRKDFFVDLKVPASLTQGDKPRFSAQVHHKGVNGQADVRLTIYAGGREQVDPKTIALKGDGVAEVAFDLFEVPDGDNVRLTLSAKAGDKSDEVVVEVPIRPWGVQAIASASGTASDDATVFVGLPPGRAYESPEMLIVVSPTIRRMLIELAVGQDAFPLARHTKAILLPVPPNTTADRASDLLAAASALSYLKTTRAGDAPEASRLADRIRGLVGELITLQNDDGGWPWTAAGPEQQPQQRPSDRLSSARAAWALASAEPLGLLGNVGALDKAMAYLSQEFAKADVADHETRATILHALSTREKATFEQANSLNRIRQSLSNVALAYLALTYANMDRASLADEILGVLGPRSRTEPSEPGKRPRRFWEGSGQHPWHRNTAETTALATLAFARVRPEAAEVTEAIDWLQAHRIGTGWQPHKAKGPALAALASFYGKAQGAEDRYRLVVTVNDTEVYQAEVRGAAEGKAVVVPRKALKAGDRNRVQFHIEGRGTFGYAVTLTGFTRDFGPDQDRANRSFLVHRRVYFPANPEYHGKPLPTGFGVAINPNHFENTITQLALGGRARVHIDSYRVVPQNQPAWERDFLVLEEHLPAGATLIEGSVQSNGSHYELADGVLRFYFTPDQHPGNVNYEVYGYLPGQYRALPPRLSSAYEPGRQHLGPAGELRVLSPGEKSTDPYKPTPDELYARGKALFDDGQLAEAADPLESLWNGYSLQDNVAKDVARMLLFINVKEYEPRKIVQYFEVLREKAPELVIPFDTILVVGRAYRDINEHERAYLVWRAIAESSYLEDARVGEALRQRGKTLEAVVFLLDLWREYPDSASIEADFFGLSQLLASLADKAITDPPLRRELAAASVTRSELLLQAIRLAQAFLARSPRSPLADEASLALVGDFLELEDYEAVVKLSRRFAELYPKSTFLDSFQYSEALGRFHLGQYDRAIEVAEKIAAATYKDANGAEQPSPNKWQAIYILGQIHDARRQPAKALKYYEQVADRFTDAASAIKFLKREELKLPEVGIVRPPQAPAVAAAAGLRSVPPQKKGEDPKAAEKPSIKLTYRNIAEADVKVYPVDLMRLYLTRRNLDEIAGVDLAGITPLFETTVKLGDGADYEEKTRTIELPLEKEGAYLVMIRGDNLYASGIVLVTPLELETLEEADSGRVRITVRDAHTKDFVPKVQVKVIGSDNPAFLSGQTDLRGVYEAEGVVGQVTAVARLGTNRYAFYRGTTYLGTPPPPASAAAGTATKAAPARQAGKPLSQALDENLKIQNSANQLRQIDRLQQRYNTPAPSGVEVQKAY
jgi:uncharacterized protein YfaS (alpha-2-macroglobulin family)/TolA-binding protein